MLQAINARLADQGFEARAVPDAPADLPVRTLAGVMLGFPPTTHANLLATLAIWVQTKKLWELQPQWHEVPATATLPERYTAAVARLLKAGANPNASLVTIQDAGHFVHAEKPRDFNQALSTFLDRIEKKIPN